jgi:NAD(P)-dependent dehydrogenase (short-subunit alcohol dehydrogenase family)
MAEKPAQWQLEVLQEGSIDSLRPESAFSLRGKTAIVTGAAGGIGSWLAAGLAAAGASVVLTDVSAQALEPVHRLFEQSGVPSIAVALDLGAAETPDALVAAAVAAFGSVDILINCAAINKRTPIDDVTPEGFDRIIDIDLRAPYFLAQSVARQMISQGTPGSIINIGSINVAIGLEGVSVYGAAKAALSQLTKVMTVEWAHHGIRANCVSPGFMLTPLSQALWTSETQSAWLLDRVPLKRPGMPSELVGACVFLSSNAAGYISGQTLFVDGGFLAGSRWNGDI